MSVQSDCICEKQCPGAIECACVYTYDNNECHGYCIDAVPKSKTMKVALDSRIDLNLRGASLGLVGKLLADVADADIYVPGSRIDEKRDLYLEDVTLDSAIRELQLLAMIRP